MSRKDVSFGNRTKALSQAMSNASQSFWSPRSCTYVAVAPRLSGYKVIFLRSNSLALSTLSVEYQYSPAAVSAALSVGWTSTRFSYSVSICGLTFWMNRGSERLTSISRYCVLVCTSVSSSAMNRFTVLKNSGKFLRMRYTSDSPSSAGIYPLWRSSASR